MVDLLILYTAECLYRPVLVFIQLFKVAVVNLQTVMDGNVGMRNFGIK